MGMTKRVVVERRGGCLSGLAGILGVLLLASVALKYWWAALIVAVFVGLAIVGWVSERK